MGIPSIHEGDLYIRGNLSSQTVTLPQSVVSDSNVAAGAAISSSKLQHQHRLVFAQPNTTATSETKIVYRCYGATGTILQVAAGSIAACAGAATITVDLKKNGATVLSAVITLDNANTARVAELGTISGSSLVAGDVLEVVTVATAGGGTLGTGLFAVVTLQEDAV